MPRVSVVIPTYNSGDTLPRAIGSVLSQTVDDFEVVIVDDGSTDDTANIVNEYDDSRIRFVEHDQNRGGSVARNTGIELATGRYIAFLDADDEWLPRKLESQLSVLEARPKEWVAVHCNRVFRRSLAKRLGYSLARLVGARKANPPMEGGEALIREVLMGNLSTGASTLVVRADVVDAVGGFDPDFPRHQDWEFLIRLLKRGKLAHVNEPLVIKHGTGRPSAETAAEAKALLLDTFSEDVRRLEANGHPITHRQELYLAKLFMEEGAVSEGIGRVSLTSLSASEFLSVCWSIAYGVAWRLRYPLRHA